MTQPLPVHPAPLHAAWPGASAPGGVLLTPPMVQPGGRRLADPLDRFLAGLVDGLVIIAPASILLPLAVVPVMVVAAALEDPDSPWSAVLLVATFFGGATLWLVATLAAVYWYEVVYQLRHGQTLGKRWRGIRIVGLDGLPPDRDVLRRRFLATNAGTLFQVVPLVGFFLGPLAGLYNLVDGLWLLWDKPYRQCLHDKYAKTTVVKVTS